MSQGIFVTGTDTDVGKTYVSALLVKHFKKQGLAVGYYKPVLSGAVKEKGKLIPGDAAYVKEVGALSAPLHHMLSYIFEDAVSPHLASEKVGVTIEKEKILSDFTIIRKDSDFMVVEGAGGIACPFSMGKNPLLLSDIIRELQLPSVIVAPAGLGTLNQVFLTVNYAKNQGIPVLGVIFNDYDPKSEIHQDNKKVVADFVGVPLLGCVEKDAKDLTLFSNVG